MNNTVKKLSQKDHEDLLKTLKSRFEKNMQRHAVFEWSEIQMRLEEYPEKLWSLYQMEQTGGEPDLVDYDKERDEYIYYDCSMESPKGRRSVCYDHEALELRKEHKPKDSAVGMSVKMDVDLLSEGQYRKLQQLGKFDTKTSSWINTPDDIRALGGAVFGDCRYGRVFVYHNGADSYYASRGFRGSLRV